MARLESDYILHDRYRILNTIGEGGMGAVYRAEDLRLEGRYTAIKQVVTDANAPPDAQKQAREQFYREASILARLDHPSLPKVSDYFSADNEEYLVMDFVPGKDLRQILWETQQRKGRLSEDHVLLWAKQLTDALAYLHGQASPILHRDIKPANIKLTPDGTIKLVDFGLVKLMMPDDHRTITVVQGRGTAHYTPMEQYGGDSGHTDVRSDIYSLGATLYHLLTGEAPPEAKQRFLDPSILVPLRKIAPAITTRTERAVLWAMAMHPDDRPQSIEQLADVLLGTGTLPKDIPAIHYSMAGRAPDKMNLANLILALAVLVLLLLAVLVTAFAPKIEVLT
jgi:serine/threonine-protein kinase